jgi:hypothetical protein
VYADTVSLKSAAIAVGNGPAEAVARNTGSGSNLDGTFVGVSASGLITNYKSDVPTPLKSQGGYAYQFDGVDDYVSIPDFTYSTTTITGAAWVKTTSASARFFGQYDAGAAKRVWCMCISSGKFQTIITDNGGKYKDYSSVGSVNDGAWHHVAFTFSSGALKLYVDGVEVSVTKTTDDSFTAITDQSVAITIGCVLNSGSVVLLFAGTLDDPRLYVSALSPAQIAELYAGSEATGATPVLHIGFDEGPFGMPADGDAIWGWESQDGNRYQLVNGTAANRVVHRLTGINGYPAEEGDGASDIMRVASTAAMSVATPTIACVCKPYDVILGTPAIQALIAVQDEASTNNFVFLGIDAAGKVTIQGNNAGTAFTVTGATVLSDNGVYILLATWDGSNWQLSINGVAETETRTGTEVIPASITGLDSTTLFARNTNNTASNWYKGLIAEPFVDTLSTNEINRLLKHWKKRYAI